VVSMSEKYSEPEKSPGSDQDQYLDSVEMLHDFLEEIWHTLCCSFDSTSSLPDVKSLFAGADLSDSIQAADNVVANMLLEVMENVGRFSPWYTRSTRAFGIISIREPVSNRNQWMLAPEAVQKWQAHLDRLSNAIDRNYSLLKAMILVEGFMEKETTLETTIIAKCGCNPPRTIQLTQSVLQKAEILCDACMQPFV
jgi:hypothetical protein